MVKNTVIAYFIVDVVVDVVVDFYQFINLYQSIMNLYQFMNVDIIIQLL